MKINGSNYKTIWFDSKDKVAKIIDQTLLPFEFKIISLRTFDDVVRAIKTMQVRGAPLIGATAAHGMYFASVLKDDFVFLEQKANELKQARPTAVNLAWAVERILQKVKNVTNNVSEVILSECEKICLEDI